LNEALQIDESLIIRDAGRVVVQVGQRLESSGLSEGHTIEHQIHQYLMRVRKPLWIANVHQDSRWQTDSHHLPAYRSVAAIPLILGEESLGTLMLLHHEKGHFQAEQAGLLEGIARQIAITLNNAELFGLIRDQAENLGAMLRDQQIEASRSRGILEAVADGVIVTDVHQTISLFNASAEAILEVTSNKVIGKPLQKIAPSFEGTGSQWMTIIQRWSEGG
jgi:GAF domain-containing protein